MLDGVTLLPATFYTFVQADRGVYSNLLIADSVQETLRISATDYVTPIPAINPKNTAFNAGETLIRGYTGR